MAKSMNRRGFLKTGMLMGAAPAGFISNEERILMAALEEGIDLDREKEKNDTRTQLPTGKIGNLELPRLLFGGNLISGWCHQRDLLFVGNLATKYLTPEKQNDTLQLAQEQGINAIVLDQLQLDVVNGYKKERGGDMTTVVGIHQTGWDWEGPDFEDLKTVIDKAIDDGADAMFMHGTFSDRLVEKESGNVELLGKGVEYIRQQGYPAGLGSHDIHVPMEADKLGIEPDFYFKTFHHDRYWSATPRENRKKFCVDGETFLDHDEFHDNIFDIFPEKTAEYMKSKKQPWIAFKVMSAGTIPPQSAFQYAFENGADFIAAGMFDFEVVEDVGIAKSVLENLENRERPWRA
jgi:hypothetical protein